MIVFDNHLTVRRGDCRPALLIELLDYLCDRSEGNQDETVNALSQWLTEDHGITYDPQAGDANALKMNAHFRDAHGLDRVLPVMTSFNDDGKPFVVLPRRRGPYDFDPPYQVREVNDECVLCPA